MRRWEGEKVLSVRGGCLCLCLFNCKCLCNCPRNCICNMIRSLIDENVKRRWVGERVLSVCGGWKPGIAHPVKTSQGEAACPVLKPLRGGGTAALRGVGKMKIFSAFESFNSSRS